MQELSLYDGARGMRRAFVELALEPENSFCAAAGFSARRKKIYGVDLRSDLSVLIERRQSIIFFLTSLFINSRFQFSRNKTSLLSMKSGKGE